MINIILIRKKSGKSINLNLSRSLVISLLVLFLSLPASITYMASDLSYQKLLASSFVDTPDNSSSSSKTNKNFKLSHEEVNEIVEQAYHGELTAQQKQLDKIKHYNQEMVESLMMDLAKLQAHIIRLDALGNRLTDVAKLDKKAFNFSTDAAIGGSVDAEEIITKNRYADFDKRISSITQDIDNQTKQFDILEKLLLNQQFQQMVTPAGKPAENAYISSYFGHRKDPFTGRKKMHKGIDVAGKSGSSVLATADGIVISIKKQTGYGQVLDIDHGHGLTTRYGHNKSIVVKVGDIVKQGQMIATMGSTGRSTGPHVHYEVLKNGHPVNPERYVRIARKN